MCNSTFVFPTNIAWIQFSVICGYRYNFLTRSFWSLETITEYGAKIIWTCQWKWWDLVSWPFCFQRWLWISSCDFCYFTGKFHNLCNFSKLIVPGPMAIMHGKLACFWRTWRETHVIRMIRDHPYIMSAYFFIFLTYPPKLGN